MSQFRIAGVGMRRALGALALGMAALLGPVPGARAGQIYVLTASSLNGDAAVNFGTVDTTTGVFSQVAADVGSGRIVQNLAWNPTLGQFYTTSNIAGTPMLNTIGTDGVLSAALGSIGKTIYGMAYQESSNTLFGFDYNSDDYGTIDPSTGAWSVLTGSPGISVSSPVGGRFAIHSGTLYAAVKHAGNGRFGTFGTTAGSTFSEIGSDNFLFQDMVLASDGTTLYGLRGTGTAGNQQLYTIDPGTGALTAGPSITGTGLGTYFYGAGVVPAAAAVPEPATLASAALGGLAALWIARRRRHDGPATA